MKRCYIPLLLIGLILCASSCKGEKRMSQYKQMYQEQTATLYVAPLLDLSARRAVRETADSVFNASLATATQHLYLTAAAPLIRAGYYLPGPLASAVLSTTESRTGKQLRNDDISDYHTQLGIDAILFITLHNWRQTANTWTVYAEYQLRSTHNGGELAHFMVTATKQLPTDFKGNPRPLKADADFAKQYGCDLETAQRCRLVEVMNQYVLGDLPSGERARAYDAERHLKAHPEYFYLTLRTDGSVGLLRTADDDGTFDGFAHE